MYKYVPPKPIVITLAGQEGLKLRQIAADYIAKNLNTSGAERGSEGEQSYGVLAEIVIRNKLGMTEIKGDDHPIAYDLLLPTKVKVDVKCRGGELPFQEFYSGADGTLREAKHNLFARQVYDDRLNTNIYLMTHLERPKGGRLPGTKLQRKWRLYVCGWVSKERAKREGVYLPRGSLTERGNGWFPYRGEEIEFYHKNLNGLEKLEDLLAIGPKDVKQDAKKTGGLNLTSVDAVRITYELVGRSILDPKYIGLVKKELGIKQDINPILHPNQFFYFLGWLKTLGKVNDRQIKNLKKIMKKVSYPGI